MASSTHIEKDLDQNERRFDRNEIPSGVTPSRGTFHFHYLYGYVIDLNDSNLLFKIADPKNATENALVEYLPCESTPHWFRAPEGEPPVYNSKYLRWEEFTLLPQAKIVTVCKPRCDVRVAYLSRSCYPESSKGGQPCHPDVYALRDEAGAEKLWTLKSSVPTVVRDEIDAIIEDTLANERSADNDIVVLFRIAQQQLDPVPFGLGPDQVLVDIVEVKPFGRDPNELALKTEFSIRKMLANEEILPAANHCCQSLLNFDFVDKPFYAIDTRPDSHTEDLIHVSRQYFVIATPATPTWLPYCTYEDASKMVDSLVRRPASVSLSAEKVPMLSNEFDQLVDFDKKDQVFLFILFVFHRENLRWPPDIHFTELPGKNIRIRNSDAIESELSQSSVPIYLSELKGALNEVDQWLFMDVSRANTNADCHPVLPHVSSERIVFRQGQPNRIVNPPPFVTLSLLDRIRRVAEYTTGRLLWEHRAPCLYHQCSPPPQPVLDGFFQELGPVIQDICPSINRLGPEELRLLHRVVREAQAKQPVSRLSEAADALRSVFLSGLKCVERYRPADDGIPVPNWRSMLSNLAPILNSHNSLISLINKIQLCRIVLSQLQGVESNLHIWSAAVSALVTDKANERLHDINSSYGWVKGMNSEVDNVWSRVALTKRAVQEPLFVVRLSEHELLLKSEHREFRFCSDVAGPHSLGNTYSWDVRHGPDGFETVTCKRFRFLNFHTMALQLFSKVTCLIRGVPNNGDIETRVTGILTCNANHAHDAKCWTQLHSTATAACWVPMDYFRLYRDERSYQNWSDWFKRAYPAFIHHMASSAVTCRAPPIGIPEIDLDQLSLERGGPNRFQVRCTSPRVGTFVFEDGWSFGTFDDEYGGPMRQPDRHICNLQGNRPCDQGKDCKYFAFPLTCCVAWTRYILDGNVICEKGNRCEYEHWDPEAILAVHNRFSPNVRNGPAYVASLLFYGPDCEGSGRMSDRPRVQQWFCVMVPRGARRWQVIDLGCISISDRARREVQAVLYPINASALEVLMTLRDTDTLRGTITVFPHLIRPRQRDHVEFLPRQESIAQLAEFMDMPEEQFADEFPNICRLDEIQLSVVVSMTIYCRSTTILGTAGVGKTEVISSALLLRNRKYSEGIQMYLTQSNAPCDRFVSVQSSNMEVDRLAARSYERRLLELFTPIDYILRSGDVTSRMVAMTVDKFLGENFARDFPLISIVVDEAQGVPDVFMVALLAKARRMALDGIPFLHVCAGDPMQRTFITNGRIERSQKKCHVRRVMGGPDMLFDNVWLFTRLYRQSNPAHVELASIFEGAAAPADPMAARANPDFHKLPPLLAYPITEPPDRLPPGLLNHFRPIPETQYNRAMCEKGLELLVSIERELTRQHLDLTQFTVLFTSAYDGDICYWKYLLATTRFGRLRRAFNQVDVVVVDAVNSLEADIVILSSTRTTLDRRFKPHGLQWWSMERVKGACTRHRQLLVLLGSPRWMEHSHDNLFQLIWEKMCDLQEKPENQPDSDSPLAPFWDQAIEDNNRRMQSRPMA